MKKLFALILSFLLLCSCKAMPEATTIAEEMCSLLLRGEGTLTEKIPGFDGATINKQVEEGLYSQLKQNLEAVGGNVELEEEQLQRIVAAMMEVRKKVPYEVELIGDEKERKTLQITLGTIDSEEVDHAAAELAQEAIEDRMEELSNDQAALTNAYLEEYLNALESSFADLDPSQTTKSFTVDFVKDKLIWLPEDLNGFVQQLAATVLG